MTDGETKPITEIGGRVDLTLDQRLQQIPGRRVVSAIENLKNAAQMKKAQARSSGRLISLEEAAKDLLTG